VYTEINLKTKQTSGDAVFISNVQFVRLAVGRPTKAGDPTD